MTGALHQDEAKQPLSLTVPQIAARPCGTQ